MPSADPPAPHNPHDHLFKYVFSDPREAAAWLQGVVPDDLARDVDWDTLRLRVGSSVDAALRERQADLLFEVAFHTAPGRAASSVLLFVLLEHQSTSPFLMGWRKLEYMVRSWADWLQENAGARGLPVIFPVVLYTGPDAWDAPVEFIDLLDWDGGVVPARIRPFLPSFRYLLIKLFFELDQDILARPLGRVALRLLKHAHQPDVWEIFRTWSLRPPVERSRWSARL